MPNQRSASKLIVGAYLNDALVGKLRHIMGADDKTQSECLGEAIADYVARWEKRNGRIVDRDWERAAEPLRR